VEIGSADTYGAQQGTAATDNSQRSRSSKRRASYWNNVQYVQSDNKLKYNFKGFNFLFGSHTGKRIAPQQWPNMCAFQEWFGTRPIWMLSCPTIYAEYLHRHSLPYHGYCLAVPLRILEQQEHKPCLFLVPEMKIKACEVGWPWWPPDMFTNPLAGECGINVRCGMQW
jgi:hypothetical protein